MEVAYILISVALPASIVPFYLHGTTFAKSIRKRITLPIQLVLYVVQYLMGNCSLRVHLCLSSI